MIKNQRKINRYINKLIEELKATINRNFDVEVWFNNKHILIILFFSEMISYSNVNWIEKTSEEMFDTTNNDEILNVTDDVFSYILKENKRKYFNKKSLKEHYRFCIFEILQMNNSYMIDEIINLN